MSVKLATAGACGLAYRSDSPFAVLNGKPAFRTSAGKITRSAYCWGVAATGSTDPEPVSGPRPRVVLFSRPGCHLCDVARELVARVTADVGEQFVERDITAQTAGTGAAALDPEQLRDYLESIPVVVVDGVQVDFWHISEDRLRAALAR